MATSQQFLVCDSSTLANFKQWAQAISTAFSTFGWAQSADTGQVNWSTISSVPGSGSYVYEVWEPNDGLTNFYLKVEYGNITGSANCPTLRLSIGTSTDGAGTLTGLVMGPFTTNTSSYTIPSATTQYECNFSGAAGRMQTMLWRTGINSCQQLFSVERSLNTSGAYTSSHVTLTVIGVPATHWYSVVTQQTLVFGIGVAPKVSDSQSGSVAYGGLPARLFNWSLTSAGSSAFNNSIGFDTHVPYVGYYDLPLTGLAIGYAADFVEGVTFTSTLYGSTRTYIPTKIGPFGVAGANINGSYSPSALCMRFD